MTLIKITFVSEWKFLNETILIHSHALACKTLVCVPPSFARQSWVFMRSRANHFTFLVRIFQLFISYFHSSPSKFRLECCHDFSFQPFYMASVGISFPEFRIFKIFFFSSVFRLLNRFVAVADLFLEIILSFVCTIVEDYLLRFGVDSLTAIYCTTCL